MEEWMQRNGLKLVLAAFAFAMFVASLDIYARVAYQQLEEDKSDLKLKVIPMKEK